MGSAKPRSPRQGFPHTLKKQYEPTPEEIAAECRKIREENLAQKRRMGLPVDPVEFDWEGDDGF